MTPSVRKLALTAHVASSVGWVGALAVFFAHALATLVSNEDYVVRAASLAMGITAWFVIMPLSIATLVSGLVQAFGTAWGLVRHYWVMFKLVLTVVATVVLLLKMQPISYLATAAAIVEFPSQDLAGLRTSLTLHAAGGLLVLLTVLALAIYKPIGLTPFSGAPATAMPLWARVFALVLAVLVLGIGLMVVLGAHGPGAH